MEYQSSYQSALGFLVLKSDGFSISEISFSEYDIPDKNECAVLLECKQQLDNYFSGKSFIFDLPLNPEGTPFQKKVWDELIKIPYGETITYQELAIKLGDPNLVRAVGTANGRNPIAVIIPCHRVIGAGNKLVGYASGIWRKKALLALEMKHSIRKNLLF